MQLFIDTADIEQIKTAKSWGILDGCTTNPSLVSKVGKDFKSLIKMICEIVGGPVSAETVASDKEGIIREARILAAIHEHVVCKVPMTPDGIAAVSQLTEEGISTNVTLVFSANQALLAAKAGASYVSPFIGRLDDIGQTGTDLIEEIVTIFDRHEFETEILAASIRSPIQVKEVAKAGAHVATVPFNILQQLFRHTLTDVGLRRFLADWQKIPENLRQI
ncbi:MAG: fructose-6-phosphate aldolase [archaeon]